jgi:hypothetical protein
LTLPIEGILISSLSHIWLPEPLTWQFLQQFEWGEKMKNLGMGFLGLCLLPLLSMTACYTTPVSLEKASPTPSNRLLAFQDANDPGNSRVTVIRDMGLGVPGCYLEIYVNETVAARIDTGEKVTFYLSPGPVLLGVGPDLKGKPLCGYDPGNSTQIKTTLRPNEEKFFRISLSAVGTVHLSREKVDK